LFHLRYALFFVATVLIYSYNYHFLWIIYDIIITALFLYFVARNRITLTYIQRSILILTITYYFLISVYSNNSFIAFLSTWDTLKHIMLFLLMSELQINAGGWYKNNFFQSLHKFIGIAFFIQIPLVLYQAWAYQGKGMVYFDDVAGTFGDGAVYSLAYLSLLYIFLSIALKKNKLFILILVTITIIMNILAENVGFFILLPMFLFWFILNQKVRFRTVLTTLVTTSIALILLGNIISGDASFGDKIESRISSSVLESNMDLTQPGRGTALLIAFDLGGWFGIGPGSFSNIYLLKGYYSGMLNDSAQINIAESSHLIFESGVVGLLLVAVLYCSFIVEWFGRLRNKVYSVLLVCAGMFYSSLLMTETQIFLFILILFVFKEYYHALSAGKRTL